MTNKQLNMKSYTLNYVGISSQIKVICNQYLNMYEKDFEYNEALDEMENVSIEDAEIVTEEHKKFDELIHTILKEERVNSVTIQDYIYAIYNALYGKTLSSKIVVKDNREIIEETNEILNRFLNIAEAQEFLTGLFNKTDKDGMPVIDALDHMRWYVKKLDSGSWRWETHSPIGFLATKILGVHEEDTTVARRESRRKAEGKTDISLNNVLEDENGYKYGVEDIYIPTHEDRTIVDMDDEILNIEYLTSEEKRMFDLKVQGYTIQELQNIFHISKSQVETKWKNILKKLKNPVIEQVCATEKECIHCHEVKPLNEFVKDKRRNNGHGSICKRCDRERKKNNFTGIIGKIAV